VANSSDIDKVFRPLDVLGSDVWERGFAKGRFDGLLDLFLAKGAEHGR
jgi:hypothetical protein